MPRFEKSFRHKNISQFKVGQFHFTNHILVIMDDDETRFNAKLAEFEKLWEGLHGSDKNAIKALKAISNEESVSEGIRKSLAVRGAVATTDIADRPVDAKAGEGQKAQDGESAPAPEGATQPPVAPVANTLSHFKVR